METGSAVKYGQCWVFSAVTTTVCRALGLPCRSVTNYVSAHDTNQSLTIDRFFDKSGEELDSRDNPEIGSDSIWNFHVWNEVFLRGRGHWPEIYAGWAAVDATPQVLKLNSKDIFSFSYAPKNKNVKIPRHKNFRTK